LKKAVPFILLALWSHAVTAGPVLDRVKAEQRVHCGAAIRPGLLEAAGNAQWAGLTVDVCRAVATAVLGSPDKVEISYYETDRQFDRIARGEDDLAFLTGSEIHLHGYAGKVVPGPAVFYETHRIIVPAGSPAHSIADLAGQKVCMPSGSRVERSLSDYFKQHDLELLPIPFTERGEMLDGYQAKVCVALADESTGLADIIAEGAGRTNRLLPGMTATFPLLATTGTRDAEWSAIVAWTVDTLIAGERRETYWYAGGAEAMPVEAKELGLDHGWQSRVLKAVGDYGAIYDRHFGPKARLMLARDVNQNQANGGLLLAPFRE